MTALVIVAAATQAADATEPDCAPGEIHADVDGRPLTPEEKIARLDDALRDSLARFDECQAAASVSADADAGARGARGDAADTGGSAGSVAGANGGDAESAEPGGTVESVAAEGIQGTEAPEETTGTGSGNEPPTDSGGVPSSTRGDIPDDIPAPDNDSVLEAQIRRAAMEETDPRIRAELWNEYRKYKGLPTRPLPDEEGGPSDAPESQ